MNEIPFTVAERKMIIDLVIDGKKIKAIYQYRILTKVGLREAKDFIELLLEESSPELSIEDKERKLNKLLIDYGHADTDINMSDNIQNSKILQSNIHTNARSANKQGVAVGCFAGWGVAGCLIPVGIFLCFTGIGLIIGIPFIIAGILALFFGPLFGLGSLKGPCPWCGTIERTRGHVNGFICSGCGKHILVKNDKFYKVD